MNIFRSSTFLFVCVPILVFPALKKSFWTDPSTFSNVQSTFIPLTPPSIPSILPAPWSLGLLFPTHPILPSNRFGSSTSQMLATYLILYYFLNKQFDRGLNPRRGHRQQHQHRYPLHSSLCTLNFLTMRSTLYDPHSTLYTLHFPLGSPHSNFTLGTPHSTL